jgi:hypothetical protein
MEKALKTPKNSLKTRKNPTERTRNKKRIKMGKAGERQTSSRAELEALLSRVEAKRCDFVISEPAKIVSQKPIF